MDSTRPHPDYRLTPLVCVPLIAFQPCCAERRPVSSFEGSRVASLGREGWASDASVQSQTTIGVQSKGGSEGPPLRTPSINHQPGYAQLKPCFPIGIERIRLPVAA